MTNESLKKYMTSLSPEVREKVRKCQTKEELFALTRTGSRRLCSRVQYGCIPKAAGRDRVSKAIS
ncbi:MAG: hypothetical protein K6F91_01650 [Ruminococcus sp.]|nr:hypothetical protein [Ruminococcus sp.]